MEKTNRKIQNRLSDFKPNDFIYSEINHTAPILALISKDIITLKESYALLTLILITNSGKDSFLIRTSDLENYFKCGANVVRDILKKFSDLGILPPLKVRARTKTLNLNIHRLYELAQEGI